MQMSNFNLDLPYIICCVLAFIPAIVLHEVGHGFAAYKLGDPTAKSAGRLSLNPLKHIDPFGTVLMPVLLMLMNWPVFGYAKPVPYDPRYFKNKKVGDFIVGMAGPFMNLLQALIGALITWILYFTVIQANGQAHHLANNEIFQYFYYYFLFLFVMYNLFLMVFNLIPIPPLDGSSILALLIPNKYMNTYYKVQQYALPIFFIVVIVLPYVCNVNPIGLLLQVTAGNLFNALMPITF